MSFLSAPCIKVRMGVGGCAQILNDNDKQTNESTNYKFSIIKFSDRYFKNDISNEKFRLFQKYDNFSYLLNYFGKNSLFKKFITTTQEKKESTKSYLQSFR